MAILDIKTYPDAVLRGKACPVEKDDKGLQRLVADMIETMRDSFGIGLAAPQVGVQKRLIIIDISHYDEGCELLVLINPEIELAEEIVDSEEGCLSLPEFTAHIKRAGRVIVTGLDRNCNPVRIEATGILARALQHEIDHLDGVLIIDRMSAIKREFFEKRHQKALKESRS
jgi:peptide deformylase